MIKFITKLQKYLKILGCYLLIIPILSLCACSIYTTSQIDNYGEYLNNLDNSNSDNDNDNDNDDNDDNGNDDNDDDNDNDADDWKKRLEDEGFTILNNNGFDTAISFNTNSYAIVNHNNDTMLMDKSGSLQVINDKSIMTSNVQYDKYLYNESELIGVKDIHGNILIEAQYSNIEIYKSIIVAKNDNNKYFLYDNSNLLKSNLDGHLAVYNDEMVLYNYMLCDLELNPVKYDIYNVMSESINGMRLIERAGGIGELSYMGYVSDSGELIEPKFLQAYPFNEYGYAYVEIGEFSNSKGNIINKSGDIIYSETDGKKPIHFDGDYIIYMTNNRTFGVADKNFISIGDTQFLAIQNQSIYNEFIINNYTNSRFYSLKDCVYLDSEYIKVQVAGNYFVVKNLDDSYSLLDFNLNEILTECEYINFDGEFLLVKNQKCYFYKI